MRVGITGAAGLLGWHLRSFVLSIPGWQGVAADRATFSSSGSLDEFVSQCDVIVHLAGMNRGPDTEVAATKPQVS